jgi:hypothetical protein
MTNTTQTGHASTLFQKYELRHLPDFGHIVWTLAYIHALSTITNTRNEGISNPFRPPNLTYVGPETAPHHSSGPFEPHVFIT